MRAGLECRFYDCSATLEPDADEFERLLGPRVRALYLIHYLGHPQDAARWRRWCDERNLLLLEDAAHAWLASVDGQPVGSVGHLAIYCLYKTFGVPDGGALLVRAPAPQPEGKQTLGFGQLARGHAHWVLQRAGRFGRFAGNGRPASVLEDFDLGDPGAPPSAATPFLLQRIADERASVVRRANYRLLLEELGGEVGDPFRSLAPGASPFVLPIESHDKYRLLARLAELGIEAVDLWPQAHPSLDAGRFPGAAARRAATVGLPVHQDLRLTDVERIASAATNRRSPSLPFRLERLSSVDEIAEEWDDLAARTENVFATPDWADAWWRHFGGGQRAILTACRAADGRLVAVLPLYVFSARPLRILRFIGHGPADELGPVCAPADRGLASRALRQLLSETDADVLVAENLSEDAGWRGLLGGAVLKQEASPVLDLSADSWDELRGRWSSNLRQQAGRFERNLERKHGLRYELAEDPESLPKDLDDLFALHADRWGPDSAFLGAREAFHRDFAARALRRGRLRLWFLVADGRRVAAWYGFRFGASESFYQAGRAPEWERRSVGFVLLVHSIREALQDGMKEYRFLRGEERFKYRLATRDPGLESLAVATGVTGTAAIAAGRALLRGSFGGSVEHRLALRRESSTAPDAR